MYIHYIVARWLMPPCFIYILRVCVCAHEYYAGVGIGCSFHLVQGSERDRGERGIKERMSERENDRERGDDEKPPGGTPSPQQCVIR